MEGKRDRKRLWRCRCECGGVATADSWSLKSLHTSSCGCLRFDRQRESVFKHGRCHTSAYYRWSAMRSRCSKPKNPEYKNYGGRGIRVCKRWGRFENFIADMGEPTPMQHLDRINNDGNYEPSNCRWVDFVTSARNTRRARIVTYSGNRLCVTELASRLNIAPTTIFYRLKKGIPLTIPFKKYKTKSSTP